MNNKGASFGTIVGIIGSSLIALGVAFLIAQNWHQIPAPVKVVILLGAAGVSFAGGVMFRLREYQGIGKSLFVLGSLLYTLSIFLIAQIYHTDISAQGYAWLLLLAWVGVVAAAYIFKSSVSLVVGLVEFLIWLVLQYFAFYTNAAFISSFSFGILAVIFLITAVLFFGVSLWHRVKNNDFAMLYQGWTAFYVLIFSYLLTFQLVLPELWNSTGDYPKGILLFLWILGVIAFGILFSGIMYSKRSISTWEIGGFSLLVVLLVGVLSLASMFNGGGDSSWFGNRQFSTAQWAVWIIANIVFITIILAIIGFGTWTNNPFMINLGIVFFALGIVTRYIGFVIRLRGYASLSVIFITGGIVLLVGGWGIEKWRRSLITKAKKS